MDARRTTERVRELGRAEANRVCFECQGKVRLPGAPSPSPIAPRPHPARLLSRAKWPHQSRRRPQNPTYINMFNHTFVCEKCAGYLYATEAPQPARMHAVFAASRHFWRADLGRTATAAI